MKKFLLLIALIISGVGFVSAQYVGNNTIIDYDGYSLQFIVTSVEPAECELISYDGSPTDIIIPATVTFGETEFEVTSIGGSAFNACSSLTGIEIPSGVTSIGVSAFSSCSSLTNISFGENSQLTSIGEYAFSSCSSLTSIEIPSGVTSIGVSAFNDCSSLTNISFGENSQLTSIGDAAFVGCYSLTSIEIPSGVTSIGVSAFSSCSSLTNISFGENSQLTSIVDGAFYGCSSLTSIEIPSGVTSIGGYAFYGCSSLTIIEIPSGVTSIGNGVFGDCYSLTGIEIPCGVTSIGDVAFYGCSFLTSIEIPSGVTSIGSEAFRDCFSLTSIEIPSGVTSIGSSAFYSCSSLRFIRCHAAEVPTTGEMPLGDCYSIQNIQVPEASVDDYKAASYWNEYNITKIYPYFIGEELVVDYDGYSLKYTAMEDYRCSVRCYAQPSEPTSITIPTTVTFGETELEVTSIGSSAFYSCLSLTSIEIPSGVTSIGSSAFYGCSSLTSVSFGENSQLASIGYSAFGACKNLKNIDIPNSVISILGNAFSECSNLKSLEIPENVAEIGRGIISNCNNIERITVDEDNVVFDSRDNCNAIIKTSENKLVIGCKNTIIPSSVTSIGDYAFASSNIAELVIPNSVTSIGDYAFASSNIAELVIPNSVTSIGDFVFISSSLTNIEISNSVTSIGDYAFQGCHELVSVAFEEGSQLSSLGLAPFYGCDELRNVELPSGITEIGSSTFMGCSKLTSIEIPSGVTSIGGRAFFNCYSLWNINFEDESQLSVIGGEAFRECYMLTNIEIPAGVTEIGYLALSGIAHIICRKGTPIMLSDDFSEYNATIFVPESSVENYESTYPWSNHEILPIDPASVNVTVNDEEAGSVIGAGNYCKSMEIRLLATPNRGYDFVGWKEDGEIVSTDSDYYFTLYGDRNLEAVFELSKYWHPDLHLYPNTMNMITEVKVDGELQNSTLLEVGAFCGDELRGSGRIQYNAAADKYIAYISVMGETDDQIKFRLFDHETYQELSHASLSVLPFETNAIVGTVTEPYLTEFSSTARVTVTINPSDAGYVEGAGDYPIGSMVSLKATNYLPYLFESWTINGEVVGTTKTYNFVATESVNIKANFTCSQRTELSSGWNWTSFHTFIYGYNGLLALELSLGDYGLHIKNQNSFVTNHNGTWYGSLTSVDVEQMYIIRVSEDFTLVLNGLVVNPENYQISLTKNWKWIGYPVSVEMPVAEALSGITPSDGDVIKTQGEFAMYNEGIGWSGNLTKMKPGKGYMYYNNSNSTKTLTYPTPSSGQSRNVETEDEITHWTADDTKYPSNMNMVAVLNVDGNELGANYEIAAFAGEELRGNARPIYIESLDRYMLFLTISGEETENLKFRCYNEETGEEFDLTENIMFSMNAVVGSVDEPYVFNCNINDEAKDTAEIDVYPNPVNAGEEINLGMTYDKVEIYNAIGAKIAEYNNVNKLAQIEIAGIYVIKATIGGEVKYDRLIVQ